MTNSKRISITTESREIFIVRFQGKSNIRGFCAECAAETDLLTIDEAVSFAETSARELIRLIDSGEAHAIETASGHLLVCQNSLQQFCR